jgi:hypothetical protein
MTATPLRRILALAGIALLATVLTACFNERDENTNEGTQPSAGELVVEVLITDDAIEMPAEIPGGPLLFEVTNGGTEPHGIAIDGVDGSLDSLQPDQLDTLHLDLEPGTYTVYSPADGDREAGLELQVTVTQRTDASGAPLNDEGVGPSEQQAPIGDD